MSFSKSNTFTFNNDLKGVEDLGSPLDNTSLYINDFSDNLQTFPYFRELNELIVNISIEDYIELISLFDSIHDFKKTCSDILFKARDGNVYLDKLFFSILRISFGLSIDYSSAFSNFVSTFHKMYKPSILPSKELESFFFINRIVKRNEGFMIYNGIKQILKSKKSAKISVIVKKIYHTFKQRDGEAIQLIVDTQKKIFKLIKFAGNGMRFDFCLTAESINDPASKLYPKKKSLLTKKKSYVRKPFQENYYYEELQHPRTYEETAGLFKPTFSDLRIRDDEKANVKISLQKRGAVSAVETYSESIINTGRKHSNSISKIKKQMRGITKSIHYEKKIKTTVNDYLNNDNNDKLDKLNYLYNQETAFVKEDIVRLFTQKRFGDQLQAEVCRFAINNPDEIRLIKYENGFTNAGESKNLHNPVLVTIDRMLFAYAILINIPAIFDSGDTIITYKPPPPTQPPVVQVAGKNPKKSFHTKETSKRKIKTPIHIQKGGTKHKKKVDSPPPPVTRSKTLTTRSHEVELLDEFTENPEILYDSIPLILILAKLCPDLTLSSKSTSKKKHSRFEMIVNKWIRKTIAMLQTTTEFVLTYDKHDIPFLRTNNNFDDIRDSDTSDRRFIKIDDTDTIVYYKTNVTERRTLDNYVFDINKIQFGLHTRRLAELLETYKTEDEFDPELIEGATDEYYIHQHIEHYIEALETEYDYEIQLPLIGGALESTITQENTQKTHEDILLASIILTYYKNKPSIELNPNHPLENMIKENRYLLQKYQNLFVKYNPLSKKIRDTQSVSKPKSKLSYIHIFSQPSTFALTLTSFYGNYAIILSYFRIFSMYELHLIQDNELIALHFDEYYGEANTPDFIYF